MELLIKNAIGMRGFEPPASCSQSRRATKLRYIPLATFSVYHFSGNLLHIILESDFVILMTLLPGVADSSEN